MYKPSLLSILRPAMTYLIMNWLSTFRWLCQQLYVTFPRCFTSSSPPSECIMHAYVILTSWDFSNSYSIKMFSYERELTSGKKKKKKKKALTGKVPRRICLSRPGVRAGFRCGLDLPWPFHDPVYTYIYIGMPIDHHRAHTFPRLFEETSWTDTIIDTELTFWLGLIRGSSINSCATTTHGRCGETSLRW